MDLNNYGEQTEERPIVLKVNLIKLELSGIKVSWLCNTYNKMAPQLPSFFIIVATIEEK